jgi:hypothetical protein
VNADQITSALGISTTESSAATDSVRRHLIDERASFITETEFSDPVGAKIQFLREAVASAYDVTLIYIGIANADLSEARVIQRVQGGGTMFRRSGCKDGSPNRSRTWLKRWPSFLQFEFATIAIALDVRFVMSSLSRMA